MLKAPSGLGAGPETHVFSSLHRCLSRRGFRRLRRRLFGDRPDSALALQYSIEHARALMVHNHGFTKVRVNNYPASNGPSLATIASAMPDLYRVGARKRRRVRSP